MAPKMSAGLGFTAREEQEEEEEEEEGGERRGKLLLGMQGPLVAQ